MASIIDKDEFDDPVVLHDAQGNVIKTGGDPSDPMILGADSHVSPFRYRDQDRYPKYPKELFDLEQDWFLQFAMALAAHCEVDLLDELTYAKLFKPFRQTRLCAVINLADVSLHSGSANWEGLVIYAKDYKIVKVMLQAHLPSRTIGIPTIHLWRKASQAYTIVGSLVGPSAISRNTAYEVIAKYLDEEVFSVKVAKHQGELV